MIFDYLRMIEAKNSKSKAIRATYIFNSNIKATTIHCWWRHKIILYFEYSTKLLANRNKNTQIIDKDNP